ncbi:MAG: copper resistance protein CopC [Pseudohongiella sp.]|nr:copper resistance protein CopC [Pseudohongiella sp.]
MNIYNISRKIFLASLLAVMSTAVLAHTTLVSSAPAENEHLEMSPEKLVLTFTEPVRLMQVKMAAENGDQVSLGTPDNQSVNTHELSVPSLSAGQYTVTWVILGSDGHRMEESFGFMLGTAAAQTEPSAEDHSAHQH